MRNFLYFFLFLPLICVAQPNHQWYEANDRGNRFEGSYTRKVSNPSINLVSLSNNLPAYTFGEKQQLKVRFFSPDPSTYQLHAEELRISRFYWMEDKNQKSRDGWNEFSNWQVDYFLKRLSIDHRNLGVLIRLGDKGDRSFTPAVIYTEEYPSAPRRYIAQIRLGRPSSGGSFNLFKGQSKIPSNLIHEQVISKKSSGTVFPIVIPFENLEEGGNWYTIEINLKEARTGDPFTYSFYFFHAPKS